LHFVGVFITSVVEHVLYFILTFMDLQTKCMFLFSAFCLR